MGVEVRQLLTIPLLPIRFAGAPGRRTGQLGRWPIDIDAEVAAFTPRGTVYADAFGGVIMVLDHATGRRAKTSSTLPLCDHPFLAFFNATSRSRSLWFPIVPVSIGHFYLARLGHAATGVGWIWRGVDIDISGNRFYSRNALPVSVSGLTHLGNARGGV